jgi:hypothetical protein
VNLEIDGSIFVMSNSDLGSELPMYISCTVLLLPYSTWFFAEVFGICASVTFQHDKFSGPISSKNSSV